jgi:hypothetical protein
MRLNVAPHHVNFGLYYIIASGYRSGTEDA